jgi:hypothetical protein
MALPEGKQLDLDTMEIVDVKPEPKDEPKDQPTDADEPEPNEDDEPEEPKDDEPEEPKDDEPEEPKDDEPEELKDDEPEEPKDDEVEQVGVDDFIKEKYAESLGVNSEEELDAKIESFVKLNSDFEALKAEHETLKASADKPKFATPQEEKAFEFLKEYDITNIGEGAETLAKIVTMDIEKANPRILLEEKFIIEHPELTREESLRKFNRDYNKKYVVKEDDFETKEAYEEELADRKIDEKVAVSKAREFLSKKQQELKGKAKEVKPEPTENPVIQQSINQHVSKVDAYLNKFESVTYAPTEDKKDNFTIKFSKDQLKAIRDGVKGWVSNPKSYDDKGKIIGDFNEEKNTIAVAYLLFGEDMMAKMYAHAMSQADIKRADQIAQKKPTRDAKTAIDGVAGMSEEKQQEMMIRKKKAERAKQTRVYQH